MEARDKILATTALLRDNVVVGTPEMVAYNWWARRKARGRQRMLPERNRGHLISFAWVMTSRRRDEAVSPQSISG
jgi:hypothetical protein